MDIVLWITGGETEQLPALVGLTTTFLFVQNLIVLVPLLFSILDRVRKCFKYFVEMF